MATATILYSSPTAITIGLAGLASSSSLLAGRESNEIDNTTNKYTGCLVQGKITTGTSPTSSKTIAVYVWGSDTSAATTARDVIDGADSAETITSANVRDGFLRLGAAMFTDGTSNQAYEFGPFAVEALFGGVMPRYWGLFVVHDSVAALHATAGNHVLQFVGLKYDVT